MPLTFGGTFSAEMIKTRLRFFWSMVVNLPSGALYLSEYPVTVGGHVHSPIIATVGDIAQLIDRKDPTRFDLSAVKVDFNNMLTFNGERFSSQFSPDLEASACDVYLNFILDDLSTVQELLFKGVPEAPPADYGYKDGSISLAAFLQTYLDRQSLRVLSDLDTVTQFGPLPGFPFIRSADNGKAVPIVFGFNKKCPARIVKEGWASPPKPNEGNASTGTLKEIKAGPNSVTETLTITFTTSTNFSLVGSVSGSMGIGSTLSDNYFPGFFHYKYNIAAASWGGPFVAGDVFTALIDKTSGAQAIFSESPGSTPVQALTQLFWNNYPVQSAVTLGSSGGGGQVTLGKAPNIGKNSGATAPFMEVISAQYDPTHLLGVMAGHYEYTYTYQVGTFDESGPTGNGSIDAIAPGVPLPKPSSAPAITVEDIDSGVDPGNHRWMLTYVSDYGETPAGATTQSFLVNRGFLTPPTVEPQISYEGAGGLFLNNSEPARSWVYTWVTADGETTPSPARSVQVLDIPLALYGIKVGVIVPSPPPGASVKIYRTEPSGSSTLSQLNESSQYGLIATGFGVPVTGGLKFFDDGSVLGGVFPPTGNTTGGPARIELSQIEIGGPGTVKKRIYRTTDNDNGPFKLVGEIPNDVTIFVDAVSDAALIASSPTIDPPDYRVGNHPVLPLDQDLSADKTNMACAIQVTIPALATPWPQEYGGVAPSTHIRVYRSKKDRTGTHYLVHEFDTVWGSGDSTFLDTTPDSGLGTEEPPGTAAGTTDNNSMWAMRAYLPTALPMRSVALTVARVGIVDQDIQIEVIAGGYFGAASPDGGTTLATVQIPSWAIATTFSSFDNILDNVVIIPPGWVWVKVSTSQSDPDKFYVIQTTSAIPGAELMRQSSQAGKWIIFPDTSLAFFIKGVAFTLDTQIADRAGKQVAMATFDWPLSSNDDITCDIAGIQDDGSGTFTGTANSLITVPTDVVSWFMQTIPKLPSANIDLAGSFAATKALYGSLYKFNGVLQESGKTCKEVLMKWGIESRSIPAWSKDQLEWRWLPTVLDVTTASVTITDEDIVSDSSGLPQIRPQRLGRSEVVNSIKLFFERRANVSGTPIDAYESQLQKVDIDSVTRFGLLEQPQWFLMDYITDPAIAEDLMAFWFSRVSSPDPRRVKVTVPLKFLAIDQDDIIQFDTTVPLWGVGSDPPLWGSGPVIDGLVPGALFQVEGKTIKADLSLELTVRELI